MFKPVRPVDWKPLDPVSLMPGIIRILDQTRLPTEMVYIDTTDSRVVWNAIRSLQVRGAPAIGVTAAFGVAAAVQDATKSSLTELRAVTEATAEYLATARPTAVNLFWALDRMTRCARALPDMMQAEAFRLRLIQEAMAIRDEDAAMCRTIGQHGATLLRDGMTVLTHCNAGSLATAEYGTALAPVYAMHEAGRRIAVFADETRPLLQGARLTAWELTQAGIDTTLICDNTAAQVMKEKRIDAVLVGADRIAANGDTANKVGTYGVAVLAHAHGIPFYVLAPTSTMDPACPTGAEIPIEERSADEVICGFGRQTAPSDVRVYSPAFDVTPARLICAIICETGILRPDYSRSIPLAVQTSTCHAHDG